jgi:hypothetical protein
VSIRQRAREASHKAAEPKQAAPSSEGGLSFNTRRNG